MPTRTLVYFWTAVATAVVLAGGLYDMLSKPGAAGSFQGIVVVALSSAGLAIAFVVALRITLADARARRRRKADGMQLE